MTIDAMATGPWAASDPPVATLGGLFARSAALHGGRLCPRQVLGVRLGLRAGELLGLALPQADKRLLTLVETDGCFADGVAVATGCRLGRRTLRLVDHGKVAATVVDTRTGRAFRLRPHPAARERAPDYAPGAPTRWQAQLLGYQAMPADQLLQAAAVTLTIPVEALVGRPGLRVPCARCGEEIGNGREVIVAGRPLCRSCAGGGYYR